MASGHKPENHFENLAATTVVQNC